MDQDSNGLTSSVQVLSLNKGMYLVSVTSAAPRRVGDEGEFVLPALHVGTGPGNSGAEVEIVSGPRTSGPWLFENRDMLIIKVVTGPASVLLTSLRTAAMPAMEVEVRRLDAKPSAPAPQPIEAPPPPPPMEAVSEPVAQPEPVPQPMLGARRRTPLRTRISLHVQNKGDIAYVDNFWAGALGERLAIESFAISPLEGLTPEQIEYKGLTESGVDTGWISGGADCGSRGLATALTGFAVRVKPGQAVAYECEYRGSFSSGTIVGPERNGALCRAASGDRLEAMQIFITERRSKIEAAGDQQLPVDLRANRAEAEPRSVGPRFSVFRENVE
ncbi:MAG TPA: hypothetical protein VII63_09005 [Caulobacteraceae bacterium]